MSLQRDLCDVWETVFGAPAGRIMERVDERPDELDRPGWRYGVDENRDADNRVDWT